MKAGVGVAIPAGRSIIRQTYEKSALVRWDTPEKYPDHLEVDIKGEKPKLKPKEGYDEQNLPDFFSDLGLKSPVKSLDEDNVEEVLVPAARRRIAMDRQQLLATMIMMGVNRLVVTNGTIEASCMFELDTRDVRRRTNTASAMAEQQKIAAREWGDQGSYGETGKGEIQGNLNWNWTGSHAQGTGSFGASYDSSKSWYNKGSQQDTAKFIMHTASTQSDEQTLNMHAQLGGKVKVNFKSDYFPMEKMVDVMQINQIRERTAVANAGTQPATPTPAAPTPPAKR